MSKPKPEKSAALKAQEKQYSQVVDKNAPQPPIVMNCIKAFLVGGLICAIAQLIQYLLLANFNFSKLTVGAPTSAIMIFIAVVLTACGVYDKLAQFAGAGTAVPITGFANSMCSAAIEYRSEGFVLGVGGNMFKVAGPVIVFGAVAAFIVVIIRAIVMAVMGV